MTPEIEAMRARLALLGKLLFDRHLTDAAGGNMSARVGDLVCLTPRYCGSKWQWNLRPSQVLVCDLDGQQLDGDGELSREGRRAAQQRDERAVVLVGPRGLARDRAVPHGCPPAEQAAQMPACLVAERGADIRVHGRQLDQIVESGIADRHVVPIDEPRHRLDAMVRDGLLAQHHECSPAVGDRRGVAGVHGAVLLEDRRQLGELV